MGHDWNRGAEWSPNGSKIAFTGYKQGTWDDILVINADGSGMVEVRSDDESDSYPVWSPDGSKIAFYHTGDIAIVNTDGTGLTTLTDSPSAEGLLAW